MAFLDNLNWRYATKAFDTAKKVSEEDLQKILEAVRLSPSSFGLQPFHVHVVSNQTTKDELKTHAWGQAQFSDASHILVFSGRTDLMERINQLMHMASEGNPEAREQMKAYENMMIGFADARDPAWIKNWAERQAYIALGFAMAACAELQIDSCPMEGFDPAAFDKVLKLPDHFKSVVTLAVGYRKEPATPPKKRFSGEDLFSKVA